MNTPKIEIDLQPSKRLGALMGFMFMASVAIILYLPIGPIFKMILLIPSTIYSGTIFLQHVLLYNDSSIRKISLSSNGVWQIQTNKGKLQAELNKNSTATNAVCLLQFNLTNPTRKQSCIIFKDAVASDVFKRLLVQIQ